MRKLTSAIILLALSSVSLSAASKTEVCHKNRKTLTVADSAVSAHLGHGDTLGICEDDSTDPDPETRAAVVMMRCEAIAGNGVDVVSASSSPALEGEVAIILPFPPVEVDCADALAGLLNAGFLLRSINSGSAEDEDGDLHLYTDYLLIGKVPAIP